MPVANHEPISVLISFASVLRQEILNLCVDRRLQHLLRARTHNLIQRTSLIELSAERNDLGIISHWI